MISSKITCCCGTILNAQVFEIDPGKSVEKALVFVNWCKCCGARLAEVRKINRFGREVVELPMRTGEAASKMHEKYAVRPTKRAYAVQKGSKIGEYTFFNHFGSIWNLNNRLVCSHEEFLAAG